MKYTKKQLNEMETATRIIYLIHNKVNGKNYVGQTVKTFNERYGGPGVGAERVFGHTNSKLQKDLEKYGPHRFKVTILEKDVEDIETLNKLEKQYIKQYNGVTKGYNTLLGGNNYDKDVFYSMRREIKKLYLQLKTIQNIINNVDEYEKLDNGFYVMQVEMQVDALGYDPDLHKYVIKSAEYWKQCCIEKINDKINEVCDLGFDLTLQDVIQYYNL